MVPWHLQPQYAGRRCRDEVGKHRGVDKGETSQGRRANSAETADRPESVLQETEHSTSDDDKGSRSDHSIHGPVTHEDNLTRLGYQTFQRFYHVFRQGELGSLVHLATPTADIVEEYYDHENWCVLAKKT